MIHNKSSNNTVEIVNDLLIVPDWGKKNVDSRHKIKVLPHDALVIGINLKIKAVF